MRLTTNTPGRFEPEADGVPQYPVTTYMVNNQTGAPNLYMRYQGDFLDGYGDGDHYAWGDHGGSGVGFREGYGYFIGAEHIHLLILDWWRWSE